jgi:hypothetical protein
VVGLPPRELDGFQNSAVGEEEGALRSICILFTFLRHVVIGGSDQLRHKAAVGLDTVNVIIEQAYVTEDSERGTNRPKSF